MIYINIDGVLLNNKNIFQELLSEYKKEDIIVNDYNFNNYFSNTTEQEEFFDLYGQTIYNNILCFNKELNETITLANSLLYPVILFNNKYYNKQFYHLSNLINKQIDLTVSGLIIRNIKETEKLFYFTDELNFENKINPYDNELINFLKEIEQTKKQEIYGKV